MSARALPGEGKMRAIVQDRYGSPDFLELRAQLSRVLMTQLRSQIASQRIVFLARARHKNLVALKELAEAGKLSPVIDRQYPTSEAPDALRYLETGHARGKVVINVA